MRMIVRGCGLRAKEANPYSFAKSRFYLGWATGARRPDLRRGAARFLDTVWTRDAENTRYRGRRRACGFRFADPARFP